MEAPGLLPVVQDDPNEQMIAIVGMDGVFPDAGNVHEFWNNLLSGTESGVSFTRDELERAGVAFNLIDAPNLVTRRPMLRQCDQFDARFFDYSDLEAQALDPQLRFLLQCGYRALEESGSVSASKRLRGGTFLGVRHSRYLDEHLMPSQSHCASLGSEYMQMINRKDSAATLVAYKLGLGGPAISVNTACSTSLLAVHLACNSLLSHECDVALAGGSAIPSFGPDGNLYVPGGFLSKDGRCRPFSYDAGGTIDGAGVGVVALKRHADAVRDGNLIHALILGSAVNNDGDDKVGYSAPSVNGQMRVISDALSLAGVGAETIGYVEAHGTGTKLGDPIEFRALSQAYRRHTGRSAYCALGSLKANIGHLGVAAGIAGLIKTALAVREARIPKQINFAQPNPDVPLVGSPFFLPRETMDWPVQAGPRRAAVSSFGIGGTNVHMIVQQPPAPVVAAAGAVGVKRLCVLSAKSSDALAAGAAAIGTQLADLPAARFDDLASTLLRQRAHLPWRTFVVADGATGLAATWSRPLAHAICSKAAPKLAFMFPGQGSQHRGMGQALRRLPAYAQAFDHAAALFRRYGGLDLLTLINADDEAVLTATEHAQPVLFATGYAMCVAWQTLGLAPAALLGHSIGELVAACIAGVFSLEDGVRLVCARARLMQSAAPGAMLAVFLSEQKLQPLLGAVELAAVNGPATCVVSGGLAQIDALQVQLAERGIEARRLHTSHAFHSAFMDEAASQFEEVVRSVSLAPPGIAVISNVSGAVLTDAEAQSAQYWAHQLRAPVRFLQGLQSMAAMGIDCVLEIGAGTSLTTLAQGAMLPLAAIASQPHILRAQQGDAADAAFLQAAGELWLHGFALDLAACNGASQNFASVALPGYQFEPRRHWVNAAPREQPAREPQPQPEAAVQRVELRPLLALPSISAEVDASYDLQIMAAQLSGELSAAVLADGHRLKEGGAAIVHSAQPVETALLGMHQHPFQVVADFAQQANRLALLDLLGAGALRGSLVLLEGHAFELGATTYPRFAPEPAFSKLIGMTMAQAQTQREAAAAAAAGAPVLNLIVLAGSAEALAESVDAGGDAQGAWLMLDTPDSADAERLARQRIVRERLLRAGARSVSWLVLLRPLSQLSETELASMLRQAGAQRDGVYVEAGLGKQSESIQTGEEKQKMAVESEHNGVAAAADTGKVLDVVREIWMQVLALEHIGLDDNFFDLGGNSLWALQIVSSVNQAFGCDIELSQLLNAATIKDLAALVEQKLFNEIDDGELQQLLAACSELSEEDLQNLLQN